MLQACPPRRAREPGRRSLRPGRDAGETLIEAQLAGAFIAAVTQLACIGHWYTDLLYAAPIGAMVGLVGVDKAKQRLRGRREARRGPRRASSTA
jgi:hypothetical protein